MADAHQQSAENKRRPIRGGAERVPMHVRYLPVSGFCLLIAAIFFAASLTPSLMPRGAAVQGVLAGAVAIVGYGVGRFLLWLWLLLEIPRPPVGWQTAVRRGCYLVAGVILLAATWKAADWQNATRAVVNMEPVATSQPLIIVAVSVCVFLMTWLLAWVFWYCLHNLRLQFDRLLPPRVSALLAFLLAVWVFWVVGEGVLLRNILQIADSTLEAADRFIEPTIPRPTEPLRTGSPSSVISWEEMGRWGRDYVHRAPSKEEIAEFTGPEAKDPIRVYVGLCAAPSPQERAHLALKELIRVGAFQRSALVVMVPVGTGWMDPGAQDSLEFILGGDVATVAVQYSYLRAALSVMADSEVGFEQARTLFNTIYAYWLKLPKDERPKFYVHGLSQGAQISQNTLPLLDFLAEPIDGVLWVGTPFFGRFWMYVRDRKDPQSPVWQPRYGNGSLIRVANQQSGLEQFDAPWGPIRMIFLNYGSDPIVFFTYDMAYQRPDWLREPRAFDVSTDLRWFPIVTMLQVGLDTTISLKAPGYGHYYVAEDYIDAWAELLEPTDWTVERAADLKAIFQGRPPAF